MEGGVFIDKKLKNKIILFLVLFLVCILASLFVSEYIFSKFSEIQTVWIDYIPHTIIASIIKNQLHAMIFLSISMTFLLIIILIMNNGSGNNFASELDEITDNIKTPKKVGQAQHGSARWLTQSEQDKIFTSYTIDKDNNKELKKLMETGKNQAKEVQEYQRKTFK